MASLSGKRAAPKRAPAKKAPVKKAPVKKAPAKKAPARLPPKSANTAISPGDIGTTKPLGVYDPLQIMSKYPEKYRRWQEMEIKHGRFAMAACLHVFLTEYGVRWPGYLSLAEDIKFTDMPGGTIASWAALPNLAWAQIVLIVALLDNSVLAQDPTKAPGDVAPFWYRFEDKPGQFGKEYQLNVERNNGRAAMMGITGMIIHEALTGNPLFPISVPEQPILLDALDDIEKGPARVGSFVLVSLGMAFCGFVASVPEFQKKQAQNA
jgi:light-harvesting complex I chlorophyll a/b binding protein 1